MRGVAVPRSEAPRGAAGDWHKTFERLVVASTAKEMEGVLQPYLTANPLDDVARRPGVGHHCLGWGGGPGSRSGGHRASKSFFLFFCFCFYVFLFFCFYYLIDYN